jgi:hypothetical protein
LQRGFPVAIALKKKTKPQPKVTKAMAVNKEAGKRSEVPFSRREEGRELGEKRKRKKLCQILTGKPLRKILETWRC